jgi:HlyD family secretion protein
VSRGDLLIRFDVTRFEAEREREQAALRQADADLVHAAEDTRLDALRAQEELDAARQQVANAERVLLNEVSGKGQVAVIEAETTLAEADREFVRAQTNLKDLKPLLDEQFITRAEYERAEQALQHAADQQRLAAARRDAMARFERPAAASRAQSELNAAREALARQAETAAARAAQRRAVVTAAASRVGDIRSRIAVLGDQIDRGSVRADGAGLVVYREIYFGGDRRKPEVGDEVFANQPLVQLPDSSQFVVETRVREIDLHRIAASQQVQVRLDAYPELRLPAVVAMVGALALDDAGRANTKYFPVTVKLAGTDARLRTGMTARVEVEVASLPSALVVPAQAVFDDKAGRYVVVLRRGRAERRRVTLAGENETSAAIATGLSPGDTVLLIDPTR